jgi:nitrate/nitrite-specific signal transduction histidine kinase
MQSQILYLTIAIMFVTAILFFFVTRTALLPLSELTGYAIGIGEGKLNTPIPVKGSSEIAVLAESLESMRVELLKGNKNLHDVLAGLEQRVTERTAVAEKARMEAESAQAHLEVEVWLAKGQTRIGDVMRGEQNTTQLAENIITQLCQYMDIQSGALFLLNENTLSLVSAYAFSGRMGFTGQLQLGEGLAGQAALDGRKMVLSDIDPNARIISTGLADFKPRAVLAFPFHANSKVVGVIELAALFEFEEKHFELLNRLSETIGMGFVTVQIRQHLVDLLAESRHQAEEI